MEYWIHRDDQEHGPYSKDDLLHFYKNRQLSLDEYCWYEGCDDWVLCRDLDIDFSPSPKSTQISSQTKSWQRNSRVVSKSKHGKTGSRRSPRRAVLVTTPKKMNQWALLLP
jgi:hypothetical protein